MHQPEKIENNRACQASTRRVPERLKAWWPPLVVWLVSMLIYGLTLAPTVTGEDSGELIAAAYGTGVAHPSGYPLWTILATLSIKLLPFGAVAWRVNLLSAVLAALAAAVLCRILQRFLALKPLMAVSAALCFASGRHLWSQAVIAEVYTLHVLLFCLVLYFTMAWLQTVRNRDLYMVALLAGLALANHHVAVLLGPVLLATVLARRARIFISPRVIILSLVFLMVGLLPYLYLPVAAHDNPYLNWGDPDTWEAFVRHVLRQQYGDESMHAARTPHRLLGHLGVLWSWNVEQYTLAAVPLIIAGVVHLARRQKQLFYLSLALFAVHTVGLMGLMNFNFQRQELFCARVFQLPAYVISALWLAVGAQQIAVQLAAYLPGRRLAIVLPEALLAILWSIILLSNFNANNMRHYYYAYDHAGNILDSLEPNALILPSGDHNTFPVIYRHYVEGLRPDIVIGDKYGYIEYGLYQGMPDAPPRIRTRRQREEIEAYLIKSSGRPVYYTVKPRLDLLEGYRAATYGMLFRIFAPDEEVLARKLPQYYYRNLTDSHSAYDHAATVILSDYHFQLAANALRQGRTELALNHIDQAAALSAGLKEEMNNLGTLLAEFGLNGQAVGFYERAARLDNRYLTPRWNLAHLFKAQGDTMHAIQVFNDLARIESKDYRIFGELGFLLRQYGDEQLAIQNWGKSLALNPDQPQVLDALRKISSPLK